MTKPMNFPGRKQARRLSAIERLKYSASVHTKNNWDIPFGLSDSILRTLENIEVGGFKLTKKRCPAGRKNRKNNK